MKLKIKCSYENEQIVDYILKKNEKTTSKKFNTYHYTYKNNIISIDGENKKTLIYTIRWIDDLIDRELRKSNSRFSIVEHELHEFSENSISLSEQDKEIIETIRELSFVKDIKFTENYLSFKFDFYSKLIWNKGTKINTKRGLLNMKTVYVESHNKLFTLSWVGQLKGIVNVRIHYMCETSEIFDSLHCDCLKQKNNFLDQMHKRNNDIFIYAHEEGRNLGLTNKLIAYEDTRLNDSSTKEAMINVAGVSEMRMFEIPADILFQLNIKEINLWTNNPLKINPIIQRGIKVNRKEIWIKGISVQADKYINEKIEEMEHFNEKV